MSSSNCPTALETFFHQGLPSPLDTRRHIESHEEIDAYMAAIPRTFASATAPGASPPAFITSPNGMIHVYGYTPTEGEQGVPITVHIDFNDKYFQAVYVRLVVGQKPIATRVRELFETTFGRWQLEGAAPAFAGQQSASAKVQISVQALNGNSVVLDSFTFGEFTYWESECTCAQPCQSLRSHHEKAAAEDNQPSGITPVPPADTGPPPRRRTHKQLPTPSPHFSDRVPPSKTRQRRHKLRRRTKGQSLRRTMCAHPGEVLGALDFVTPLENLCRGWDEFELHAGRRLVRFWSIRQGHRLQVSCERITQDEYRPSDTVISCIYREEANNCFVTSVDIIFLLERLVDEEFAVEEKNRIRRNLEGLHPTTISKHKAAVQDFFQRIMDFPDPKPRNIEKDLKVFEWRLLDQALEKIISKYSLYSEPVKSGTPSTTSDHTLGGQLSDEQQDIKPTFTEVSDETTQLMYPSSSDDEFSSTYADPTLVGESPPGEAMFMSPAGSSGYYGHTVSPFSTADALSPTVSRSYFVDPSDLSNSQESSSNSGSWVSDMNMGAAHGVRDFIPDVYPEGAYPLNTYDSLEFQTLREHSLQSASGSDRFM